MPLDGPGEDFGLLAELLGVVLAEMRLGGFALVQGENVIRWL